MSSRTVAQEAVKLYKMGLDSVESGGTQLRHIPAHIAIMVFGYHVYPDQTNIWRVREFPDKTITLETFEDYLLFEPRRGLGVPSLFWLKQILDAHGKKSERDKAYLALRQEIPDFDDKVKAEKAKLAVERVAPAKDKGAPEGIANNPHGIGGKSDKKADANAVTGENKTDIDKMANSHFIKPLDQQSSDSQARIIAKLKREQTKEDIPDVRRKLATSLLNQMAAGEMSARSAAITMGWKKPVDPMAQVQKYLDALSATDKIGLWEELGRSLPDGFDYLSAAKEAAMNLEADEIAQFKAWIATEL